MKRILVAVDFSPVTEEQLKFVDDLVEPDGGDVLLLHVLNPSPHYMGYGTAGELAEMPESELRAQLEGMADKLKLRLERDGVKVAVLLDHGEAIPRILMEAERTNSDLIVLGSHGHGSLYDLLVGSTSEGVLRKASCPVVLVPSPRTHA